MQLVLDFLGVNKTIYKLQFGFCKINNWDTGDIVMGVSLN